MSGAVKGDKDEFRATPCSFSADSSKVVSLLPFFFFHTSVIANVLFCFSFSLVFLFCSSFTAWCNVRYCNNAHYCSTETKNVASIAHGITI